MEIPDTRSLLSRRDVVQRASAGSVAVAATGFFPANLMAQEGPATPAATSAATPAATPAGTPSATPAGGTPAAGAPELVSQPQVFDYGDFQFQFLIALGATYERAADIGECFVAASRITDYDYNSWVSEWEALGDRIHDMAQASEERGHAVSARDAYLRAATYYSRAYDFVDGTSDPSQLVPMWEKHRAAADAFFALLDPPAEQVEIPYEDTTLPGYAITVDDSGEPRPWLIVNNGSDGTVTDVWVQGAAAAIRRGYNVLLFDGPGEGAALYRQNLYFRPDWEKVITPVVDWMLEHGDVDPDRIAILGISQGGYWVPRAVAFEHRIAGAIADPGVVDVSTSFTRQLPPELLDALRTLKGHELEQVRPRSCAGRSRGSAVRVYADVPNAALWHNVVR